MTKMTVGTGNNEYYHMGITFLTNVCKETAPYDHVMYHLYSKCHRVNSIGDIHLADDTFNLHKLYYTILKVAYPLLLVVIVM